LGTKNRQGVHIWQLPAGIPKQIGSDYTFLALPEQKKLNSIAAERRSELIQLPNEKPVSP
jgi:hypothetical protein